MDNLAGREGALRDADRRKDQFLAKLAHELGNPLAPVSAAAELLSLGKLAPESAKKAILLNNAAKYTASGGTVNVRMSVTDSVICVEVSDNGIGIEPAVQKFRFDLFEQVHTTSDRTMGGLGIGLALVRSLAHLHGSSVTCESGGLGQGSCFRLCMPALARDEFMPERRSAQRAVDLPAASASLSVLVVDDNQDAAEMLQFFLSTAGHRVTLAATARATRQAVSSAPLDVCILDIGLPDGNGNELAVDIGQMTQPSPMLFTLSGFGMTCDRDQTAVAGFDHYFVKPVDLDALSAAVEGAGPQSRLT